MGKKKNIGFKQQKEKKDFRIYGVRKEEADFVSTEYSDQLMDGIYDNIMSIPPEDRELSAIILDDCLGSIRQHSSMNRITSTVRHMKSLLVYSLQACKGLPPTVRSNISLTIVYYTPSTKQMNDLVEMRSHMGGEENWLGVEI